MIDDLLAGAVWLVLAVAAVFVYRRTFSGYWTKEHDPLIFDLDDPEDEYEYRCTIEQRRWGRERGGPVIFRRDSKNGA